MVTDDEKYISRKQVYTRDELRAFANRNARDNLAVGFDLKKTFLFCDFDFMEGSFYLNVVKNSHCITCNTSKAALGFTETDYKKTSLIPSTRIYIFESRAT